MQRLLNPASRDASQDEHTNKLLLATCTPREAKAPALAGAFLAISSLTMTYFHTGIRTIIGAESFHCPVRDGKEWDQLAMVIRLKRFLTWCALGGNQTSQFAESITLSALILIASRREHHAARDIHRLTCFQTIRQTWPLNLIQCAQIHQSYRVKPHGQLVLVSLTHYCASTPSLSTSWSTTTLQGAQGPGKTHLETSFPLRCFQRLSLPHLATRQCHWRDNRYTRGASTPVLSY